MSKKQIPKSALHLRSPMQVDISIDESSKNAPITMLARTPNPISHPFWGKLVHDMSGMKLRKDRVAIDFNHRSDEPIGFADNITADAEKGLMMSGLLTPFRDDDRASEIIFKSKSGVPYEASMDFYDLEALKLQYVDEFETAEVNGYEFEGPGYIAREWGLPGVAVVLHGADPMTNSQLSKENNDLIEVEIINKQQRETKQMSKEKPAEPVEVSKEELQAENESLKSQNAELSAENEKLKAEKSKEEKLKEKPADNMALLSQLKGEFGAEIACDAVGEAEPYKFAAKKLKEQNAELFSQIDGLNEKVAELSSGADPVTPAKKPKEKKLLF